ncbi:MAG: LssY C-terminal domain-containing protein [Mesorhizobium sp.]|nr:LssY C-terminal domain-containing protein [Mesorhizobium sp.]MBL8576702.1 LssY C-terminal domain-containing protein [Mesorhizobium sp.]
MATTTEEPLKHHPKRSRRAATASLVALLAYLAAAYVAAPEFWWIHDGRLRGEDMRTTTTDGIPGDPINVGLVGVRNDVLQAFAAAGWRPADAITLKTSIEIGLSVVLHEPDPDAPVSTLVYDGRRQDLAFEKPVGDSADQRHHVRLWQTDPIAPGAQGPLWLAAASFDRGVGVSHDTGQITHHIGPDLDAERDFVVSNLSEDGWVRSTYEIEGAGATKTGRNGGGDPYFTDGKVLVGVLGKPAE